MESTACGARDASSASIGLKRCSGSTRWSVPSRRSFPASFPRRWRGEGSGLVRISVQGSRPSASSGDLCEASTLKPAVAGQVGESDSACPKPKWRVAAGRREGSGMAHPAEQPFAVSIARRNDPTVERHGIDLRKFRPWLMPSPAGLDRQAQRMVNLFFCRPDWTALRPN